MSGPRYVRFVSGRYWLTVNKTGEHPYKVFKDRYEMKVWLVEQGVQRSVAEDCLTEADSGTVALVLLPRV